MAKESEVSSPVRVVGIGFDHMHIGDQLKTAIDHPDAEVVGVLDADPNAARAVLTALGIDVPVTSDFEELITVARPDMAFICSSTAAHPLWVERLSRVGVHMIIEKPVAGSLAEAEKMVADAEAGEVVMAVNWPLAWVASHRTAKRLVTEGAIGQILTVHSYGGNRGPLYHSHGKAELHPTVEDKVNSWWYSAELGGGSQRDYLGYAATLSTWYRDGEMPWAVTAARHVPEGLEVDEQSVVIGHYAEGLSVFETRWGTYTDPWVQQPQPGCGYILNGTKGSIASWDYDDGVTLHNAAGVQRVANDTIAFEDQTSLANLIAHLRHGRPLDPPMTPEISLSGHRIVEAAVQSAKTNTLVTVDSL